MKGASLDPIYTGFVAGAIAALDKRTADLRARASIGITVAVGEHGPATIVSSEAAEALKLAHDFEEIARDLEAGAT